MLVKISILVTSFEYWTLLVPDAHVERLRMLVTKTAKTITNISKLSPTHFVSIICHQHPFNRPPSLASALDSLVWSKVLLISNLPEFRNRRTVYLV